MLTKSDYLLYLDSPLHLWAQKHNKLNKNAPSAYDQHLMKQGYEVEKLAHELLPNAIWQDTVIDKDFEIRTDALVKNNDGTYNLYEVKSSTQIEERHKKDATFQSIVLCEKYKLEKIYIVNLNKDYVYKDKLDITELFQITDITNIVNDLTEVVKEEMNKALNISNLESYGKIENCLDPKSCPCLSLCYPNLPKKSIFNIPNLKANKKRDLVDDGILDIKNVSDDFELSVKQRKIVDIINSNIPYINKSGLTNFLNKFEYPIYFLDYETYPLAIPIYNGFKPYQQMVFQYSLHIVNGDKSISHSEFLQTEIGDPTQKLLESLKQDIGETGSVIVWNKTFEMGRNKDMITICPEYKEFLENVNSRVIDLADFINKSLYIHPDFLGSWSIKNVLPVMVPDLSYKNLKVNKGDIAMLAWWELINNDDKSKAKDLLEYCGLDTMAMVKIWERLEMLIVDPIP